MTVNAPELDAQNTEPATETGPLLGVLHEQAVDRQLAGWMHKIEAETAPAALWDLARKLDDAFIVRACESAGSGDQRRLLNPTSSPSEGRTRGMSRAASMDVSSR